MASGCAVLSPATDSLFKKQRVSDPSSSSSPASTCTYPAVSYGCRAQDGSSTERQASDTISEQSSHASSSSWMPSTSAQADASLTSTVEQDSYAPQYIRGTTLPVDGWFQSCRGCALKTAREMNVHGRDIPVCTQCQEKWVCMARGDFPQGKHVPGVEPLSTWIPNAVEDPMVVLTMEERRIKCESLLLGMDDVWQQLITRSEQ